MQLKEHQETAGALRIITPCSKHIYFWGKTILGEYE